MELNEEKNFIQDKFNSQVSGDFIFPSGEHEGPLIIRRSCIVDGCGSTLWAKKGPVIVVAAENVTIKNLRIEITEFANNPEEKTAIKTLYPDTKIYNVEVFGNLEGFHEELFKWNLPRVIRLGNFAADEENIFTLNLSAAADAEIQNNIQGSKIMPSELSTGDNVIFLKVASMRDNTILYGDILIKTLVSRRIYITGHALNGAKKFTAKFPEFKHDEALSLNDGRNSEIKTARSNENDSKLDIEIPETNKIVVKGQRLSLKDIQDSEIKIIYTHKDTKTKLDIDAYIFMLQENGKVRSDNDLIFWGSKVLNPAIKIQKDNIILNLSKVESSINKISVCFSIYGENPAINFSLVKEPAINIVHGDRILYKFNLDGLNLEKTIVAAEFYRYKNEWRINFIGSGWHEGLKQLCNNFGVDVE